MKRSIVLLSLILVVTFAKGQEAPSLPKRIYIDHHSIPGVIRSTYVASIVQDEYGLLWFGSSSGLYRFDGNHFTGYPYVSPEGVNLDNRQIISLLWDSVAHRLLIGTRMSGLLQFDYESNKISLITEKEPTVNSLAQTADGRLWTATPNGLFEIIGKDYRMIGNAFDFRSPSTVMADGKNLLVAAVRQVLVFSGGEQIRTFPLEEEGRSFPITTRVTAMLLDKKGQLWVGTENEGVVVYDYKTGHFIKSFTPDQRPFFSRINAIHQDVDGFIWILTKAEGIALVDPETNAMRNMRQDIYEQNTLSANDCYSILEDQTGVLWIGTSGDINFYDREQRKFKHYSYVPNKPNTLSDNMVRSVYEGPDGKLWVGTDGGFINFIDLNSGTIQPLAVMGKDLPKTESVIPFCYAPLDEERMLIGTTIGLLEFNMSSKQFRYFQPTLKHIKDKRVRQLIIKDQKLYGIYQGVFFEFDLVTQQFQTYIPPKRTLTTVIYIDPQDRFWVGSNGVISLFDRATRKMVHTPLPRDSANYMLLSIEQVKDRILISTMNNGIFEMKVEGDKTEISRNITVRDGLPDNTVYATLSDEFGNIWMPTNRGLARLDPNGRFTTYQVNEGLQGEEFNRLAQVKLRNGQLVMGGINGINVIDPIKAITKTGLARPLIFSISTRKGNELTETETPVMMKEQVDLASEETSFAVQFGVNDYRKPVRFTAKYKLEGLEDSWITSPAFNRINYSQLRPGLYTFRLVVTNPAGEQLENSLHIYIHPPFWMTWWFRLLLSVMIITAAILGFRIRVSREKKDKEKLEELLRIRTQEIEESREQLANLNERKDLIFSILSHDLRSPLTTLKGFLGLLIEDGAMFSKEEIKKHAEMIRASVANSLDLIDNTLFWSLSQMEGLQVNPVRIGVTDLVKKITGLYHLAITRKGIKLQVTVESGLQVLADENMLYVILRNLVSNAIKFTPDGKSISINAYSKGNRVYLEVKDEGVGMNQEYIAKLLTDVHPTIKKGTSNEKGTGLGLLLCRQFAEAIQGTLTIESEEGRGSTFILTIPSV